MRLAFYKATSGDWVDKAIAWWTRPCQFAPWKTGIYSHVEIVFDDGMCFSSSPRDGGTRWKRIDDIDTSGKWDFILLPNMTPGEEKNINSMCVRECGKKYDWPCIMFGWMLPLDIQDQHRWFCSEFAAAIVLHLPQPHRYSPNSLYKYLIEHNYPQQNK